MFNKNNNNGKTHKEIKFKQIFPVIIKFLNTHVFRQFLVFGILVSVAVILTFEGVEYLTYESVLEKETAEIQNEAAIISAEYAGYSSLSLANKDGMNRRLDNYSAVNQVRIRVIDYNYVVYYDTYTVDNNKTVINSIVFTTFDEEKSISNYNKDAMNIEATAPIINDSGELMGVLVLDKNIKDIDMMFNDVNGNNNYVKIVIITLSLVILMVLIYFINRPLKRAYDIVKKINEGHTDIRVPVVGSTEYKEIARDFNGIMDKANEIDKSRAEFVSNVSHELKTPITSIKVLAESLNTQEDIPIELYKEFMQDIVSEIDRENKIIEDLLSLVRLDKSADELNISSVNMNECLEMVLRRLKPLAEKKNIELLFESFRPVVAEIDEVKMTQVLSNLVENAIKYNHDDGWVHVSLNADHQYFYVRVEDSGIGIPEDSQNKVFERFYRVDKARSRETGGTGLGLAIVKNIIIMHHGNIKIHSEEDVGTTFTVRIPLNYVK